MATYKIDRSRNLSYVGKFKFNYEVVVGIDGQPFARGQFFWNTGAYFDFNFAGGAFQASGLVANNPPDSFPYFDHGWDGNSYIFGPGDVQPGTQNRIIRFNYFLKDNFNSIKDNFILEIFPIDESGIKSTTVSGTIEGSVFYGMPLDEYVDIDEYYPMELGDPTPTNCGDNENWIPKKLDKDTVRQWPKYTTLNWYEVPDLNKKSTFGIKIVHTNSKGKINTYSRSYTTNTSFFPTSYVCSKQFNAWNGNITNSGYCSVSSNVPLSDTDQQIIAQTNYSYIDFENFNLKVHPNANKRSNPKVAARFFTESEPTRKVSFEAVVKDWTQNYPDKLTAYIVGFASTGYPTFSYNKNIYPEATYKTIESSNGVFNAGEQTYKFLKAYSLEARDDTPNYDGYPEVSGANGALIPFYELDNRQIWIHGVVDGALAKEKFDLLEMPPSHFDYPDYWVNQNGQCININYPPQRRTIDGYALTSRPIPLPLRGWKFNAMSIKQDKEYPIAGSGNIRIYKGVPGNTNYYGDLNLSGYRYLQAQIKSPNGESASGQIEITETSNGPSLNAGGTWTENIKSWNINTNSKDYVNIRIDLCNPDNSIDFVDNQDSPYPRLNTYTTSKPKTTEVFGYLAKENLPKDDFIITKKSQSDSSLDWIKADTKSKIINSGFVYLTDSASGALDYFEVDKQRFPSTGGTNVIYGKPRSLNGKLKLAKFWNGSLPEAFDNADYRKTIYLYIPQNDITKDKSIDQFIEKDSKGNYPNEYQIFDYDFGNPDLSDVVSNITKKFVDGSSVVYVNPIKAFNQNLTVPYNAILLIDSVTKKSKKYKIIDYIDDQVNTGLSYITIERSTNPDPNLIFNLGSTTVQLTFFDNDTDDTFRSIFIKFKSIVKIGNTYKATLEYAKQNIGDSPDTEGIPLKNGDNYNFFSLNAPIVPLTNPKLVEFTFPINSPLRLNLTTNSPSGPEVNAIDDYPEDEANNGPFYGITRANKIELVSSGLELGQLKLVRDNSLGNFVSSGNNNVFEEKTRFQVSSTLETNYYTRRFFQQNTDGRDEEEGDISWQNSISETINTWDLFPKSISQLCDNINKVDEYVAPRWLDSSNPSGSVIRHPGWIATSVPKKQNIDPITGKVIFSNNLDPEYLNSETGYASWVLGNGLMALPSGSNTGSGTTYKLAIDISLNDLQNLLAQTIFHRMNANFPPGKPDLFGNTSLLNKDGTSQESTLHLRGGMVVRGPGYGLILPPQKSTPENLRKANLFDTTENQNAGSDESDAKGYFETTMPYGKNSHNNYIELEKSTNFSTPSDYRSSTRKMSQSKRERAAFKGGKENVATNLSACESGFENSIVIAYTVPTTTIGNENQTAIIQTDSFFSKQYEKFPVGYNALSGSGVTVKGEFPFIIGSDSHINQIYKIDTFLLTERNSNTKVLHSHNFDSLIAANTDMRNKFSWYPFIDGQAKLDANFSTLSKAFKGTRFNSYVITDQATQLFNVGYADPGAILVRSISLNTTNINAPVTDKTIFIDGVPPAYISDFRLLEPITTSGSAVSSFPTLTQISSREYIVAYSLNASPRKINFKLISNYQLQDKNTLLDLDALTGNTLSDKYNIYGLTSDYDEKLKLHRSVFWCNGGIYYFEYPVSSIILGKNRFDKLHLVKGKLDEELVSELLNRKNIITYYDAKSDLNASVPKQRPALISCKKPEYNGQVFVAYDTGKCYIEAVLFHPYFKLSGVRKFDIECVNDSGSTTNTKNNNPIADIQANPTSGQSALLVNFLSTNSYDPNGSTLTYTWNFGDETQSTEENPTHTFINNTTNPIEFKVTLIVTNTNGISSVPATIIITVNPALVNNFLPQAKFSATPTSGDLILAVTFTDQSTAVNDNSFLQIYEWDFGDGNTAIKFDNASFIYDYTRSGTFIPSLKVKDNLERISDKFLGPTINVNGVLNNPPSPGFNSTQTSYSPTLKVQFTDTSSDDEGPLVAWHWDFGDKQTADVQNPEHIYADPGKYLVMLTITDSGGLQVSGSKEITVLPPGNNPPISNFIYSQQNRKLVIDFTDTSTDSDGNIVTWSWDFGDQSTDITKNPTHTYALDGKYQVTLTVTDNSGKSTSITKDVIVSPLINLSPVISSISGNQTSFKPSLIVKFTETSSDPDGFITRWDWNFGDRQTFSTTDPTLKNPSHEYVNPGIYTVTLTVTDDGLPDGTNKKTATTSIQFTVAPPPANQPPVALFTVDTNNVFAPVVINFTDASTDADGRIVSWLWEFETGRSVFYNAQTYQKTVSYTFNKSGTYPVKLTVRDDGNLSSTYILDVVIKNNAPISILSASPNPVLSQLLVSFFGNNSYDSDGNITKYAWDFGDGTIIAQGTTSESHIYSKPGSYKASLTVTDNIGDSSTANLIITVNNRLPVARITYISLSVKAPGSLTFNGDTSFDPDGIIASYNWTASNGLSATTPNTTFAFTAEGSYVVSLLVTDDSGGTNLTSVTVNVTPPDNILPISVLNVNKNSGIINDTFIFNVSNSFDSDGSIILYELNFGDGTSTRFTTLAPVSHIYKSVGLFTAKLIVTDNRNGLSIETVNSIQKITINNQPPVANFTFSANNSFTFDPITFTDISTDPDNSIIRWSWDYGDGTIFITSDPLQKSPTKSFNKGNKDYTVSLTVYDNFGLSSTTSQPIRIENRKPFAVISTNKTPINNTIVGIAPFTVIFDSNSYDLDGNVINYEWYLNGILATPVTTKSFTYTFTNARFIPFTVTLKVQDDDGSWSDLANIGVKVNFPNVPPVAIIGANPPSRTRQAPVTVDFTGAGSYDPDNVGGPLIYSWDFGNGNTSDLVNPTTVYNQPGTYKVSLTVTDNLAATNTAILDYIVLNNKPVALLESVPSGIVSFKINTPILFTSSGSYDSDINQFINGYKWLKDGINQNSNTPTFETSFDSVGNHTITLTVFDNLGLESDPVNKTIFVFDDTVPPLNQNPIAILGNEPTVSGYIELKVGDSFTFDGANSYDPEDGNNITFEWSIDGVKSGFNSTFTNQFNTIGIFTVSLVVFDTKKLSSTTATNLRQRNEILVNVSSVSNPLVNKLFSSGQALYGAIASGSNTPDRYGFLLVDDTKQYTVIESGLYHTFVVDADGKLYASGSNSNGQLGFSSNITQQNSLTLVPLASKYKVVKVSAGDYCSAIIAEDTSISKRVLLVCGSNINGIFGQALPKTNIYNFQPILERSFTNNGASFLSNNSLLDVSCNSYILAFTDNRQVWVAGSHNYSKTGISDTGFYSINIDPNPDIYVGSKNYLNPFKLEVGFNNSSGFVTGLSYDIDNQIVWFTGLSSLRGWGYAYDISTYENNIVVITASLDPYFDHAIYLYFFSYNEIPQFNVSGGLVSDTNPGLDPPENFLKVSTGKFGYLAISENLYFPYGLNDYGQLGYVQSVSNSNTLSLQAGYQDGQVLPNMSVKGTSDIAAGGNHSIILASNIKPSSYSFTITKPGGYATDPQYPTAYPITQIAE
jgi:PKD repeat protein